MATQFNRSLRLGYGFSILILLAVSLVSYLTVQSLLTSNRAVEHSGQVIQKLEKVLSAMKDAETGQRGYLLSGRANYLEPYKGASQEASMLTEQLIDLTADNMRQQNNIRIIRNILNRRFVVLQQTIDRKKIGGIIATADLDAGKAAMDQLRDAVNHAETDEQVLLKQRSVRFNRYTGLVPDFIILAAVVAMTITVISYRNIVQDYQKKEFLRKGLEASEEKTQALNEELSAANEEITAANEELTASNEELFAAREELALINDSLEQKVADRTRALRESENEAQTLNEELTATNEELAATNEELMTTNEVLAESEQRLQELVDELRMADERSAKLVAIVESSDDAIIGKDLDGIITSWNRGAEQIFGYPEAEIIGQSILTLIPENLQHEEPIILARLRKGEKIDHYETIRRTKDNGLIHVSLTISPIRDKEGRVTGVSKIARDITEQKQDEQRKNDFIGMASHELKTPLTSLNALVQVLKHKLRTNDDPFVPQALNKAGLQAKKMSSLINGFLNVSRLESGKLEITPKNFDLVALLREELEEVQLTTTSHQFYFEAPAAIELNADREKIGSVVSNLLSNAVKYSPKGKNIHVNCMPQVNEVWVSIKDEGMGIQPQDLSRIFERYYRAGSEQTRTIAGFGVGLYLCAEIIERHSGRIWVESEKGLGSIFYFSLPATTKEVNEAG